MITIHPVTHEATSPNTAARHAVVYDGQGRAMVTIAAAAALSGYPKRHLQGSNYAASKMLDYVDLGHCLLVSVESLNRLPPKK